MSNHIPSEYDVCDIREIIKTDDLVMFYDQKDLIDKLHFYLGHEEERQRMAAMGRRAALEKMTFKKLMERLMDEMPRLLEEQSRG